MRLGVQILDQRGENQLPLTLGERTQKPDYSFRLATRDGVFTFYDEIDEGTEPIASNKQRECLEAKIRFHEDYQNATGERYRVRVIFAKTSVRMVQFLSLARRHATLQRSIFYGVLLEDYLKHGSPLTSPMFIDHLYADEFQTYAGTESLQIILSQARKYGLSLCLANQLVDQMSPELACTVFGNVGSLCVMQVGHRDAQKLAEELGGGVTPEDLIVLPKYHAVLRMLIDGEPTRPFTIRTSPPAAVTARHAEAQRLVRISSQRYARTALSAF